MVVIVRTQKICKFVSCLGCPTVEKILMKACKESSTADKFDNFAYTLLWYLQIIFVFSLSLSIQCWIFQNLQKILVPKYVGKYLNFLRYYWNLHFPNGHSKFRWQKPCTCQALLTGKCHRLFPKDQIKCSTKQKFW